MIELVGSSFARVWVETTSKNAPFVRDGGIGAENKDRSGCSSGSVCLPGILVSCCLIVVWSQCVVEVEVMVERDVSCVMLVVENAVSFHKIFYGGLCVAFQECYGGYQTKHICVTRMMRSGFEDDTWYQEETSESYQEEPEWHEDQSSFFT